MGVVVDIVTWKKKGPGKLKEPKPQGSRQPGKARVQEDNKKPR